MACEPGARWITPPPRRAMASIAAWIATALVPTAIAVSGPGWRAGAGAGAGIASAPGGRAVRALSSTVDPALTASRSAAEWRLPTATTTAERASTTGPACPARLRKRLSSRISGPRLPTLTAATSVVSTMRLPWKVRCAPASTARATKKAFEPIERLLRKLRNPVLRMAMSASRERRKTLS